MKNKSSILEGNIYKCLISLSIPMMATSFLQMAYNMTDMFWIGRLGRFALSSVGTAGFYPWLAMAFIMIPKVSMEVQISQNIGKKDFDSLKKSILTNLQIGIFLGIIYAALLILLNKPAISFFNIKNTNVIKDAQDYLFILSFGIPFFFMNPIFSAIFNGYGESKIPFMYNSIGLLFNMILDPIMIFGYLGFPAMNLKGAALATIISQMIVTLVFIVQTPKKLILIKEIPKFSTFFIDFFKSSFKLGIPICFQSGLFTFFAMVLARVISSWGSDPIAVQRVGSQIEAISWMSASGFSVATSTFIGQNFGANNIKRLRLGYWKSSTIMFSLGILTTLILFIFPKQVFSIFSTDPKIIPYGIDYLRILSISQLFMCIEINTAGAFNGLGKTIPPAIIGIIFNALRIPLALFFAYNLHWGLNGVWWSISITSIIKGLILFLWILIPLYSKELSDR